MKTFYIKAGDREPVLDGVCYDENNQPVGLAGASVKLGVRRAGGKVALLTATATIVNDSAPVGHVDRGRVRYAWADGDTTTVLGPGEYEAEFQVMLSNGKKGTFPGDGYIAITVLRDIAS